MYNIMLTYTFNRDIFRDYYFINVYRCSNQYCRINYTRGKSIDVKIENRVNF